MTEPTPGANHNTRARWALPRPSLRCIPVWRRNLLVWRKLAIPSLLGNFADPLIMMLGLGYGLGALIPEVDGVRYATWLAAGTVCFSTMNSATFEALWGRKLDGDWSVIVIGDLDANVTALMLGAHGDRALGGLALVVDDFAADHQRLADLAQIGRASCRERV